MRRGRLERAAQVFGLVAARAAKKDNSYDNEPYPIVVEKVAEAVVIHDKSILSKIYDQAFCLLDIIICYF